MRIAVVALAALSCGARVDPAAREPSCEVRSWVPQPQTLALDFLLVVDRSPAMEPFLPAVERNVAAMIDGLERFTLLDLRAGVVPADGGAVATLSYRDRPAGPVASFSGALGEALASAASLGAGGSAPRPLAVVREVAPGFVRPGARLAILVIAAGDDAGDDDPVALGELLLAMKGPGVYVGVVTDPAAAPRLRTFAERLRGVVTPIRNEDFTDVIAGLDPVLYLYTPPCAMASDLDPATPALDLDCAMTEEGLGGASVLPRCPGPRPCWSARVDDALCGPGRVEIVADRDEYPWRSTTLLARCATLCD